MTPLEIIKKLDFLVHKYKPSYVLYFRGYMIEFSKSQKNEGMFIFYSKQVVSNGMYVQETNPQECKNKKAKSTWYLIQELLELSKNKDWNIEYINVVQNLLLEMFFNNSTKVKDDGTYSGNQYNMAKERYIKIKEALK